VLALEVYLENPFDGHLLLHVGSPVFEQVWDRIFQVLTSSRIWDRAKVEIRALFCLPDAPVQVLNLPANQVAGSGYTPYASAQFCLGHPPWQETS
jgi:hypothetical protein